jgi:MFS family permease
MGSDSSRSADAVGILQTWREAPIAAKALILGTFINRFGGFLQFFVVLYLIHRGFSNGQAGIAAGLYGGGGIFGVLVGGWLSDLIGPRMTIVTTMVGTAVGTLAILYVNNYAVLLVLITTLGAACQAYRPASSAMLSTLVPPTRQIMIFSMYRLAINAATTLSPLVAVLIIAVSWNLLFYVEAVTILAYAAIAFYALRAAVVEHEVQADQPEDEPRGGYLQLLTDRRYLLFLIAVFATSILYVQTLTTLPLEVAHRWNVFHFSVLLALNGFIVITCELFVSRRVQRWRSRTPILVGVAMITVGMTMFGLPFGYPILVIGTLVWTSGEMASFPMLFETYPAQVGPARLRGRYLGAANGLSNTGMAVGPIIGITLYDHIGSGVWFLCGIAGAIALVTTWAGAVPLPRDRQLAKTGSVPAEQHDDALAADA